MQNIVIFDTTLRDGEQASGAKMDIHEKLLVAKALDKLGVDIIEGGFAASSNGEFETLTKMSQILENATLCSLSRGMKNDIKLSFDAIKNAHKRRIHTFISTSDIHIKHKLNKTHDQVLEMINESVSYANTMLDDIEWSAEDATRTDFDFLCRCVEMAIKSGATTINLPDTVGYTTPSEYKNLFQKITSQFNNKDVIFSSHCHDDLGLSVANSLAAISGGAKQIECTILGIGERAGNAALEEVIMAIKTRTDVMQYKTNIDTKQLVKTAELVANITGFHPAPNKAIVGKNAFSHESGIHQDGMLKCKDTYQIINPEDVGFEKSTLTLGKLSGKKALIDKIQHLNLSLDNNDIDNIFIKFKELCDSKKHIYDSDIVALVTNSYHVSQKEIISYDIIHENNIKLITIKVKDDNTIQDIKEEISSGILDAAIKCINSHLGINPILERYDIKAVSMESDAQAHANVIVSFDNKKSNGSASHSDIVMSSIMAYFRALLLII